MENPYRNNPILTPTYQNALSRSLIDVITARNNRDIEQQWICLETLYYVTPKTVMEEIQENIKKLIENLKNIRIDGNVRTNAQRTYEEAIHRYKKAHVDEFFNIIMNALRTKGYAQLETGAKPIYDTKPHINSGGKENGQ